MVHRRVELHGPWGREERVDRVYVYSLVCARSDELLVHLGPVLEIAVGEGAHGISPAPPLCEDRTQDGPASGEKGSNVGPLARLYSG